MATPARPVEKWDDDGDLDFRPFHGGLNLSTNTNTASISSRLSSQAESVAGDDDWNLVVNDDHSTAQAIQSAQQAGIPLPKNVPASALLGGAIKRLGKKMSRQKVNDDWDNDLEMPDGVALRLKARPAQPSTRGDGEEYDEFDDLEGSLGIRFAGKRDPRNRSCSASAMSPSLGSVTAESETDELRGIELPEGPMDFEAILKKRRATDAELSDLSQASPALDQPATINVHKKSKLLSDDVNEDYLKDFDLAGQDMLGKRTMNRNIKVKSAKIVLPASSRVATTLNFHDKPTEKPTHTRSHIPRPVSGARPTSTRLEPVFESGAASSSRERRGPMTTSAQLLRSKRSMPALRSHHSPGSFNRPAVPSFNSPQPPPHKPLPHHVRRDSDPHRRRPQSPPVRPTSRLSNGVGGTSTPSRMQAPRTDLAPASLAREAAAKKTITRPARRRNYGDGNELEVFDDLPTSSIKESRFVKQPIGRGPPKAVSRPTQNRFETRDLPKRQFAVPDRMQTPGPRTPASPTKGFHDVVSYTPSYLRDTAASRIARESRLNLNQPRPKSEGPLMPLSTNWKAQVAARSPHSSPSAQRLRGPPKRPHLIKAMGEMATQRELTRGQIADTNADPSFCSTKRHGVQSADFPLGRKRERCVTFRNAASSGDPNTQQISTDVIYGTHPRCLGFAAATGTDRPHVQRRHTRRAGQQRHGLRPATNEMAEAPWRTRRLWAPVPFRHRWRGRRRLRGHRGSQRREYAHALGRGRIRYGVSCVHGHRTGRGRCARGVRSRP